MRCVDEQQTAAARSARVCRRCDRRADLSPGPPGDHACVWAGAVLVWFMGRVRGADRFWVALVFGGVLPSLVGMLVVTPLKGGAITLEPTRMLLAFVINGVWGLGTALTYRFGRRLSAGSGLVRSP